MNILICGHYFNLLLKNLPATITYLEVQCNFNKPVDTLPQTLTHLKLHSSQFNQPVDKLPLNLKYLSIYSEEFDQNVNNLPSNLRYLTLAHLSKFSHTIHYLPPSLSTLYHDIYSNSTQVIPPKISNFPCNLKKLMLSEVYIYFHQDLPALSSLRIFESIDDKPLLC